MKKFLRFLIIGGGINLTAVLIYWYLTKTDIAPELIYFIISLPSIVLSHFLNRRWSFESDAPYLPSLVKFFIINWSVVLLQIGLLSVFYRILGINSVLALIVAIGITTVINFLALKSRVFK